MADAAGGSAGPAFELVDSIRRIALTGLLVFIPEKSRASAAMLIAMLFYGVFAEAQPFSNHSLHVVAGVSNAAIACIFACLAILQGEMMPRPLLTTGCVALSWVGTGRCLFALDWTEADYEELLKRIDVPYRVVINEAIELAKSFGATDGHKYVNGILDKLAPRLRKAEVSAARKGR